MASPKAGHGRWLSDTIPSSPTGPPSNLPFNDIDCPERAKRALPPRGCILEFAVACSRVADEQLAKGGISALMQGAILLCRLKIFGRNQTGRPK